MFTCDIVDVMSQDARGQEKIGRQFGSLLYPVRIKPLDLKQHRREEAEDRAWV